jgi:putative PIN family toxin of toxin-antitoxin system
LATSPLRLEVIEFLAGLELIETTERVAVCRDPKDDKFLELALAGQADAIVMGTPIFWCSTRFVASLF